MRVRKVMPGGWRGCDFDGKMLEIAGQGGECEMSDRRGALLLNSFPGAFEVVGATGGGPATPDAGAAGGAAPTTTKRRRKGAA